MRNLLSLFLFLTILYSQDSVDQWNGFDFREAGLSQKEFQLVLQKEIARPKLMYLLELGIGVKEYLKQPWLKLNMNEAEWLDERAQGMSAEDFSFKNTSLASSNNKAYLSLLLPGYYQWHNHQPHRGLFYSSNALFTLATASYLYSQNKTLSPLPFLILWASNSILSFTDAKIHLSAQPLNQQISPETQPPSIIPDYSIKLSLNF